MTQTSYDIVTKSNGTITVPYNTGDPNNWTRGETTSFTFELPTFYNDLTVTSTYTVSSVEGYGTITVESGATLTIQSGAVLQGEKLVNNGTVDNNGTLVINDGAGDALNEYADWAGSYTTLELVDNTVKYRSQIPSNVGIDSLVWGIEPSTELQGDNVRGVWGLVEAVQNERNQALSINRFSVDLRVLGEYSDYASFSDVENNLLV